jgi:glycosyltransferase involved in cell wall biosynthesis
MRIVHLVAGAGGMYCGSCLHCNTLVWALRAAGEDVLLVPMYTPLRTDEEDQTTDRVAFGGINAYLQQRSALFQYTPRFFDQLLDHPRLLRWLSGRAWSTRPESLGALTVSVLRGEQGRQRKELDKLVRRLEEEIRPELVHLSNAMLTGTARQLAARLDVPVVCTLSGEDVFLEQIPEPHYSEARAVLRERCSDLAALVAMNHYYAGFMGEYLSVPSERIHVIPPGLNLSGHAERRKDTRSGSEELPVTIGYLSRIAPEKGLHQLVEALKLLVEDEDIPPLRLLAAGYLAETDRPYLDGIRSQLDNWGLADRFDYVGELDREAKIAFLQSLDVMSVPTVCRESKGLAILEAWANAVPVVLPEHGAFTELVKDTGGGLLCEPGSPPALAAGLKRMILDPEFASQCGRRAREAVSQRYNAPLMAQRMIELYRTLSFS